MELLCTPTVQLIVLPPREEYRSPLRKTSVFLNWEKYASLSTSKPGIVGRGMADDSSQSHTPAIPPLRLHHRKDYVESDQGICDR